jgi:DNA-binding NarL/FixJ family response regulator
VRVGLADDSELFRRAMAGLLTASGADVVLQAGSGRELLDQLDQLGSNQLDLAVLDVRMPPTFTEEGLDTAAELGRSHPGLAVLLVSTYAETAYAIRIFQRGSARRGYLLKEALDRPELRRALERLHTGGSVLDPAIVLRLIGSPRCQEALTRLTARQRQILPLLAQGYRDAEIAEALGLDEIVIQNDIGTALGELGIEESPDRLLAVLTWLRAQLRNSPDAEVSEPPGR